MHFRFHDVTKREFRWHNRRSFQIPITGPFLKSQGIYRDEIFSCGFHNVSIIWLHRNTLKHTYIKSGPKKVKRQNNGRAWGLRTPLDPAAEQRVNLYTVLTEVRCMKTTYSRNQLIASQTLWLRWAYVHVMACTYSSRRTQPINYVVFTTLCQCLCVENSWNRTGPYHGYLIGWPVRSSARSGAVRWGIPQWWAKVNYS